MNKNAIATYGFVEAVIDALAEQGAIDKARLAESLQARIEAMQEADREYDHGALLGHMAAHLRGEG